MNNKFLFIAMSALALTGCSSDELADAIDNNGGSSADETRTPIVLNTRTRNVTRAIGAGLESEYYNFGAYAYKENGSTNIVPIMGNFLVGYSQEPSSTSATDAKGYYHGNATTWSENAGTTDDHTSPWFYEGLGSSEYNYNGTAGYYTSSTSSNATQPLVYWDKSFAKTEFYCYAPYSADAQFDYSTKKLTVNADPANFLYASTTVNKADYDKDITNIAFKHANSKVKLAFYSDVPNYRVQILDLKGDNGTFVSGASDADQSGIVATPANLSNNTYSKGSYIPSGNQTITVDYSGTEPSLSYAGVATSENLHFAKPAMTQTVSVTKLGQSTTSTFNVIPAKAASGQTYSETPEIGVTPASGSGNSGFTFHVTFKLINTVTGEEVTVYNARVYVPSSATQWVSNKRYTYIFHITANASGTTDDGVVIDPSDVVVPTDKALTPIVFDGTTISDYEDGTSSEYAIN